MTDTWGLILSAASGGAIVKVTEILFSRRKTAAETSDLTATTYKKLLESINEELERVRERDTNWEKLLDNERLTTRVAQEQNFKYHLEIKALQAEMRLLKQTLALTNPQLKKQKVFVVDDLSYVLDMFKVRLGNVSLIDLHTFGTATEFMQEIEQRPVVVVLDYDLENHLTALDVIRYLKEMSIGEYYPKIIVTTGHPIDTVREKLDGDVWKIYSKDGAYIIEVSTDILEYIRELSL